MDCERLTAALIEGDPLGAGHEDHTRSCVACARLVAGTRGLAAPMVDRAPPAPDRRSLDRAVRRARLREVGLVALAAAALLGVAIGGFDPAAVPAAPPVATLAPSEATADDALLAMVDSLDRLAQAPDDLTDNTYLDLLDPFGDESTLNLGEL
jgi:hypothetical protein